MSVRETPEHVQKAMRFEYPHLSVHAKRKKPISHKTVFYMKEYGPHSHAIARIIHESMRILILAAIVSSFGGFALNGIKSALLAIAPMIILLPALNDMIGDFGTVVASRFSAMLVEGKASVHWAKNRELGDLFLQIIVSAIAVSVIAALAAVMLAGLSGFHSGPEIIFKIVTITLLDVVLMVFLIFLLAVFAGLHFYRQGEDPNNFLIPIVTSVADFANILLLSALIILFF
ncbi:MAG TPA: magnesium transporter [archaeon]|nr:magnesium transporter [archaeon]